MTASSTETADSPASDVAATHPASKLAVIGLVIGLAALVTAALAVSGIVDLGVVTPLLALAAVIVSAFGISRSHRLQDAFGGTGGYWFALAGLLVGILSVLVLLAAQSFAALD